MGGTSLWPGTPANIGHPIFGLFIVVSKNEIVAARDSEGLSKLPEPSGGENFERYIRVY